MATFCTDLVEGDLQRRVWKLLRIFEAKTTFGSTYGLRNNSKACSPAGRVGVIAHGPGQNR